MKVVKIVLVLLAIVCNEVVIDMFISDDHVQSVVENAGHEKAEKETKDVEGDKEIDLVNDTVKNISNSKHLFKSSRQYDALLMSCLFKEIHFPPPDSDIS